MTDTLAEQLRARHLLVVLDNCEHVVAACAEVVAGLSSSCLQLHVLATGRVPLTVAGEATFEVTGLPLPDPDAFSASTVAAADAARLFEVRPGRWPRTFGLVTTTPCRWPRSVGAWMGSPWRSS